MMEDGAEWSDELWTDARGRIMLGVARTGFGSQLQSWETTQIRVKPDGSVSFFAQPQGKPASEFPMVCCAATRRSNSPTPITITRSASATAARQAADG